MNDHHKVIDTRTILAMLESTQQLNNAIYDLVMAMNMFEKEERQKAEKPVKRLTVVK